jgi:hypothetical protein
MTIGGVAMLLTGCAASGTDKSAHVTTTVTRLVMWSAPGIGHSMPAADVPNFKDDPDDPAGNEWPDAARRCRAYDRVHGTTSNLMDVVASDSPGGVKVVADTPCLGPAPSR